jgi:tellurite resistance protein
MSHSFASRPTVIVRPSHATVQAMATACAMIACADGNVADKERRSFLRFLHHHGILERHGRAPCLAAFNKASGKCLRRSGHAYRGIMGGPRGSRGSTLARLY